MAYAAMSDADRTEVAAFIEKHWGSTVIMSRGRAYYPHQEEAFIERRDGRIVGLVTFRADGDGLEVLTLNSTLEGQRIGSALMLAVIDETRRRGCNRLWLTTTNDNLRAIGFYQRLGFRITAVHVGAVDEARRLKPQIPLVGRDGIEIHDELVLELQLQPYIDEPEPRPCGST